MKRRTTFQIPKLPVIHVLMMGHGGSEEKSSLHEKKPSPTVEFKMKTKEEQNDAIMLHRLGRGMLCLIQP